MRRLDLEQTSYDWHCARQGIVTGTSLKNAIGSPRVQETLMYKLIAERMTEPQIDDLNTPAISRGRELEPLARKAVIAATGIPFEETGMLASDDFPGFAFSPDAIYVEDGEVVGGLEIKCPDSKKHIEYVIANDLPKEYREQVMAPFLMSDKIQWWYFASFDDRNYEIPLFLLKVTRDRFKDLSASRKKLTDFITKVESQHTDITF